MEEIKVAIAQPIEAYLGISKMEISKNTENAKQRARKYLPGFLVNHRENKTNSANIIGNKPKAAQLHGKSSLIFRANYYGN